ncbi:MAG: hypothetical protein NVS2B5_15080 [Beijerinckiaceae bacterium]
MAKLTDKQLILLSRAVQRDDGAATISDDMSCPAAMKIGTSLVARKLMREVRTKPGMPIWRENEDGRFSLLVTRAGREAIGIEEEHDAAESVGPDAAEGSRTQKRQRVRKGSPVEIPRSVAPRPGSKQARVVAMLCKERGTTLGALIKATGWLPHTTRAALTGLRKRGFVIERIADEGRRSIYRIQAIPSERAS